MTLARNTMKGMSAAGNTADCRRTREQGLTVISKNIRSGKVYSYRDQTLWWYFAPWSDIRRIQLVGKDIWANGTI